MTLGLADPALEETQSRLVLSIPTTPRLLLFLRLHKHPDDDANDTNE